MAREVLQNYRSTFIGVKCIIEVSMIGCDVLHKINLRLQEITGVHDQPFGNLNIIFCGDLHQLPPVNASPVYKGPRNSICGPVLWQSLDYYPLEQVMRQSDSTFSEILTKIGNGERLGTEQIALIESRFRSRASCKVNVPATVRLFHRNHDADAYNNNDFIPEFENIADDKMIGYNTLTEVAIARRNLHKMSVVESGGLPYSLKLAVGYPYMINEQVTIYGTTEVDVEPQPSTSTRIRKRVRLWLEFPNPSMGQLCRVKAKPHVMCKRDVLDLKWTPIVTRAANIPLGGNINYDKSQQIQIVYVALSRVTSIDGLYLTNDKDDFKFYHGRGSTAPTVKDIRDEYDRMANNLLPTLSIQARAFCKRDVLAERNEDQGGYLHRRRQLILIVSAFNTQSLVAHAGDMESDNILMNSDYMVISETWMNCANTVMINGFELRASNNTALEHRTHCPSTSSELPVRVSAAGGSAIYRNLQSSTNCSEIIVNANKSCGNSVLRKHNVDDICLVDVKVEDLTLFILGAVYIHPKASAEAVKLCFYQSLLPYSANLIKLIRNSQPDLETPIVLCGDFNCDPQQNSYLVEFMRNEFGLNYVQTSPTTIGNTTIDCTFTRNINVDIMPYVSYFTYHRPMLNKIVVEY
ncbi:ATP-dependent DNA helicase [Trichonephila clavipes]|nr:ATP-dependent DNA helicase [Trichonephila clavipes]